MNRNNPLDILGLNTIVCRLRVSSSEILFGMTDINKALGRVLARYRAIAKISQEELADRAEIHRTYVSQIERGLKSPTLSVLLKISKSLNTTVSSLIAEAEQNIDDLYH